MDMREGPNVRRSFDGARLTYCSSAWRLDAFATKPVENPAGSFDDKPAHGTSFWGVYATRAIPQLSKTTIDAYYFGFDQNRSGYVRGVGREQRHTVGTRIDRHREGWEQDYELAGQFGDFKVAESRHGRRPLIPGIDLATRPGDPALEQS